jgi:hypothetical protein
VCDLECNSEPCDFDNGKCLPNCHCWDQLKNGCCDQECNTSDCLWDNGECTISFGCDECEYVDLPVFGDRDIYRYDDLFDDFDDLQPCCDTKLDSIEIYYDFDVINGFIAKYTQGGE